MLVYIKENELGRANFVNATVELTYISITVKNTENGEFITFSAELQIDAKFTKKALVYIFDRIKNAENDHRNILDKEYVKETAEKIQKKADEVWY
jgi:hypothetical protein